MTGFKNKYLVKLKDATIKEDAVSGSYEVRFKFEIDSSFETTIKEFRTKAGYDLFKYISFTVRQLIENILCETKSNFNVNDRKLKEMEKKSDDQGKN